jgi:hypothetical protein
MTLKSLFTAGPRPIWVRYLFIIGLFTLLTRFILDSRFSGSALLYVLVPYLVGLSLYIFVPPIKGMRRTQRFGRHLITSLAVMFCTSAILFEGFLCVLMFMPIYIFFAAIAFAMGPKYKEDNTVDYNDVFKVSFAPLFIIILSVEGLTDTTSFPRENTVTRSYIVEASLADIHANLSQPIHLKAKRSAFLSLFPLPERVEAGSLNPGDIHKSYFTYKRWGPIGVNVHQGETWLKINSVTLNKITTQVVKDTSYFSHYLTVHGTEINLDPISEDQTRVTLNINYRRDLDPAWYFGPMQKAAITESADYLIQHVIARGQLQ